MNTPQSINNRLLRLYPVHYIKENFDSEQKLQADIVNNITDKYDSKAILEFAINNINITKQSVYIYETANTYKHKNNIVATDLGLEITLQELSNKVVTIRGFHTLNVEVRLLDINRNFSELVIAIKQPYEIIIAGNYIVIKLTKVESNLKAYLGSNLEVLKSKKLTDDYTAINTILTYFDSNHSVRPQRADLNKGVKHLWDLSIIDSREVGFRRASSKATEVMDENTLYKEAYPEEYKETMKTPLESCTFRYKLEDDNFPEHFLCDATKGTLSFTTYPKSLDQIKNVIDEIIRNN